MDDLDLIRSLRADPTVIEVERRDRNRARLEAHIWGRRPRRPWPRIGMATCLASLLAGAVLLVSLDEPDTVAERVGRGAAAPAELLRQAAAAARTGRPAPDLRDGYWYMRLNQLQARGGSYRHDLRFREERWTDVGGRGRTRVELRSVRFSTREDRREHDRQSAPFRRGSIGMRDPTLTPAVRGWPLGGILLNVRGLRELPTDPKALMVRLRRLLGSQGAMLGDLSRVLGEAPLAPAARAAAFEVLAKLDGLRLAPRPAGLGRLPQGVAFIGRRDEPQDEETVVALDPKAGRILAQVRVLLQAKRRGRFGDFRAGDRIVEERYLAAAAVASLRDRP